MKEFTLVVYREVTERAFVKIKADTEESAINLFYDTYGDGEYDNLFEFKDEQVSVEAVEEENNA